MQAAPQRAEAADRRQTAAAVANENFNGIPSGVGGDEVELLVFIDVDEPEIGFIEFGGPIRKVSRRGCRPETAVATA